MNRGLGTCLRILLLPAVLSGCSLLGQSSEVALKEFDASDGQYFPDFILKFFEAARLYSARFPSLSEASSQVRLIQVKQLNQSVQINRNEANLSWSADGVYISYEQVDNKFRSIKLKNLVGDYSRDLLIRPKGQNNFLEGFVNRYVHSYNAGLSWSKDSTRFAFMSNGGIGEYNIYVGAIGVQEQAIAKSPSKDGYASWNPVYDELAFVSGRSGRGDIYLAKVKSGSLQRLTTSKEVDIFPVWSNDGQSIVFCSGDATNHDIYLVERNNERWHQPVQLTDWKEDELRPTFSPNGRYIAFYANSPEYSGNAKTSNWNIHVIPYRRGHVYSGDELRSMTVAKDVVVDLNTGPSWSPDGQKIFYVRRDAKEFNPIYAYDIFSGRRYKLNTGTKMNRDLLMSSLGVLSFRAQVGAWDRVFLALTNQGLQLQNRRSNVNSRIHYEKI